MTVLIILAVLVIALVGIVPLIERSNFRMSNEQMSKLGRWILPLLVIMLIIQLVMHYAD
ncbi:hypothetical protein [uncultured Paraglaciecola sp.]|uniref:hypothetical protein n=1 Tax=uncultured Paraglaciecola sp. TaxID=1765024 RepID=UPI0030DC6717|tara:strand:- start:8569 stop:8745 length:177 start_codon:yes stop_codon:yes gene_type:complete